MKQKDAFYLAQIAVITSPTISPERKLEILRILMDNESFARFCEEQEEQKAVE